MGAYLARINIEDSIHKDKRFFKLSVALGGRHSALGALVEAWIVAQPFWVESGSGIPASIWEEQELKNEIIDARLARIEGGYVYVCGSADQFRWLVEAKANGKKGGIAKSLNKNSSHPLAPLQPPPSEPYPLSPSPSPSLKKEEEEKTDLSPCFEAWGTSLARFGVHKDPKLDEFTILRLVKNHGVEKTSLALLGYGCQEKFDNYDPKKYCRITHLLKPDKFELCVNLGARQTKITWVTAREELEAKNAIQLDQ